MLCNMSDRTIDLKWGGTIVSLNPGDQCDVMLSFGNILLEDRFMAKFPGKLQKGCFIVGGGPDASFVPEDVPLPVKEVKEPEKKPEPPKQAISKPVGRPKKR